MTSDATSPAINTVLGPVSPSELGVTLVHEHLLINLTAQQGALPRETQLRALADAKVELSNLYLVRRAPMLNRDNALVTDIAVAVDEARQFADLGGETIVDVTLPDIGRDAGALQAIARRTGLNVIAACGHYTHLVHPTNLEDEAAEAIAERFVDEIVNGIGNTKVKPGLIGEIGTSDPIHPREAKVLRAAARAHRQTGLPISIHMHPASRLGHEVLDILESEGVNPNRVVLGHVDLALGHADLVFESALNYLRDLAKRGCYVGCDTFGKETAILNWLGGAAFWCPSDRDRMRAIAQLVEEGFGGQILISHDTSLKYTLTRYGGWGFAHILRTIAPNFESFGLDDQTFQLLLVDNPATMLTPAT